MSKNKFLSFVLISCCTISLFANSDFSDNATSETKVDPRVEDYNRFFKEINEFRIGLSDAEINKISNPFIAPITPKSNTETVAAKPLILNAIVEGERVMINNSWYKLKSVVNGLRVTSIRENSVTLSGTNKSIELFLRKKNENSIVKSNQ